MAKFEERDGKLYIDGKEVIKGFESYIGWFWFATEVTEKTDADVLYFGLDQGFDEELGYFRESELTSLGGRIWEIPKRALVWSGRRRPADELCDCEHCRCPKIKGTGEAIPMTCVTCGGRTV
ncbi:MAG: hypothetical protein HY051_02880 [Candidatus Aenigmarchaeota archaeon]|nr:hypothetical protein [Candidatus Aenigmarchaeota archaeon]